MTEPLTLSRLQALDTWPPCIQRNRYTLRGRIMRAIRHWRRPWAVVLPPPDRSCKTLALPERTYHVRGGR